MSNYPCADSTGVNMVTKAGAYCPEYVRREKEATKWIRDLVADVDKENHRRKIEQDNKHRKGEQE